MDRIIQGDCLEVLKTIEDNSIDAVVTDPPYGLSFMGKKWDYDVPKVEVWQECLRVLKPGGYLLSFAGTRTQHRMAVRIEDAGFEIRDMIAWVYGSGFPKSLNIGKAVDKLQGNKREVVGTETTPYKVDGKAKDGVSLVGSVRGDFCKQMDENGYRINIIDKGTSEWEGWGTALKPALEPITVARKPIEGNVAQNCLKWGVGGINIDGCRVGTQPHTVHGKEPGNFQPGSGETQKDYHEVTGRFPANLIHDGSDEVVGLFPQTKGDNRKSKSTYDKGIWGNAKPVESTALYSDSGSASRFFYCAKASKSERNRGCEGLEEKIDCDRNPELDSADVLMNRSANAKKNNHPTVKPIALMEYLIKLVSKENALVLDPFLGSGTTAIACQNLNRRYIGIERDSDYIKIAQARLNTPPKLL